MKLFGPVPSRRLGRSLGINNLPYKTCSYSCVYCQLGRTLKQQIQRCNYPEEKDFSENEKRIKKFITDNEHIDYITFVSNGEPTLDRRLGDKIDQMKELGTKIAVISNGSLIDNTDVQTDLMKADLVSLKIDAIEKALWTQINRPHKHLKFHRILDGIQNFSERYHGELITETMLVGRINDQPAHLEKLAVFLDAVRASNVYLSIPIRPPAEPWIIVPDGPCLNRAYHIFKERLNQVELLTGYEGNSFTMTGNLEEDLLNITSVHPMHEDAVDEFLSRTNRDWTKVNSLVKQNKLLKIQCRGNTFYIRNFNVRV